MGDISTGLGYLCGTCCGLRDAEISADGSHFRSGTKPDPRERQIDEEFMARDYKRDVGGHFVRQPTPASSIMIFPRQQSGESQSSSRRKMELTKTVESNDIEDPVQRCSPDSDPSSQLTIERRLASNEQKLQNIEPSSMELAGPPE